MSRQTLTIIGVLGATFGFGFSAGLYFNSGEFASVSTLKVAGESWAGKSEEAGTGTDLHANTLLSSRIRELEKQLAEQKQTETSGGKSRLDFFKKYKNSGLYISSFNASAQKDVKLNDAMADLLELSKDERRAVEQHLTEAKDQMVDIEDADVKIVKETPNSVAYEIPPDPQGKAVKDQLNQQLENDIGSDRAKFLTDAGDFTSTQSAYAGFGDLKTDIQIGWTTKAGKQLYTWKISTGGGSTWSDNPQEFVPDNMKKYLPTFDSK